jgi:methyl-accepting chemotaxis protein
LVILFAVMLLCTSAYLSYSQSRLVEGMVIDKATVLADAYFDNINTLMLTGGMANRDIARKKLISRPEVLDARIIRAPGVTKMYGAGSDYAAVKDELDRQALAGETLKTFLDGDDGRKLTVIIPMKGEKDVRGVNCLTCHPVAPGEVLGAVRVELSLKALDAAVNRDLMINVAINAVLMIAGLLIIGTLLSRIVSRPINALSAKMREVAEGHVDYSQPIEIGGDDEIGGLGHYFNVAVQKFGGIIDETRRQSDEATRIKTALDCVTTNVMVADKDYNIIYVNNAVLGMFKRAESDLQKMIKGFRSDNLIGRNMDYFHRNPTHQRSLLDRLNGTHDSMVTVGERSFRIIANPVINSRGDKLGVAVEWADLTAELKAEAEEQKRLEEERELSQENARIRSALDNVSSSVMMADTDRNIIYMNKTVQELFSDAERDIRKALPNFDASKLMGASIDDFHKNPPHQARLLATLNERYSSELMVGGRTMRIVANPVFSKEGERLGTAVEWTDRTDEVAVEDEVDGIIGAARAGDLSQRILVDNKQGFFKQLGMSINSLLELLEHVFDDVAEVMSAMSEGHLTKPIRSSYRGKFGQVKMDVNNTIINMERIVRDLRESSDVIRTAAGEISAGNNNLSQRTEQQASSLEETAASMEELTSTVRNNADNAQQANQVSTNARQVAMKGGEVVNHAIQAMDAINTSSSKIAEIIGVIDEIAFQTNLLALNASVEAARAGDQGRGFAVVATEVRNLAGRSAEAAKQIKELINDSVDKVKAGASLVDQSGENLTEIVDGVKRVGDIIAEIAAASAEQSAGIDQVNQAVTSMDEVTQQNAALAEQTSAASASLNEKAMEMDRMMGFFKLRDNPDEDWELDDSDDTEFSFTDARMAHLAWRQRVRDFLDGKSTLTEKEAVSHRDCRVGKWLYEEGAAERYKNLQEMQSMLKEHEELHRLIKEIVRIKTAGQVDAAEYLFKEIDPLSHKIVQHLKALESKVS